MRALKLQPQVGSRPPPAIGHHWAFIAGQLLYGKFVLQDNYWYFVIQQAPSTDIDFDNGNWIAAEWGDVWHPAQSQPAVPRQWGEKGANFQWLLASIRHVPTFALEVLRVGKNVPPPKLKNLGRP